MTDAHELQDWAGDHFPDSRRIADLERRCQIYEVHAKALGSLLSRIEMLEQKVHVAALLEERWARQRAVNEELIASLPPFYELPVEDQSKYAALHAALREALK